MVKEITEEKIKELIDIRLRVYGKQIQKNLIEISKEALDERTNQIKQEIHDTTQEIFQNMAFIKKIKKNIGESIGQEISSRLSEKGLREIVSSIVNGYTSDNLKEIIKNIIDSFSKSMLTKLEKEYRRTKDLCYSIDSEIKHTLMKMPVSAVAEEEIKKAISAAIIKNIKLEFKTDNEKFLLEKCPIV